MKPWKLFGSLLLILGLLTPVFAGDLSVTAGSVTVGTGTVNTEPGTAGATITAGQAVYKDTAGLFQLSKANGAAALRTVYGVALNGASNGQPLTVLKSGNLNPGATVVVGTVYVSSGTTAGGIAPTTDLATGWYTSIIGIGTASGNILVQINNGGVAVP